MDIFFRSDYATAWAAFGVLAQGIASIMAIAALIYSMTSFTKSLRTSNYTELDSMYFELLRIALDKPHLINPAAAATRSEEQRLEYDTYAFMVWNFLETIVDRCERDTRLCSTWYPVIDVENRMHRGWFDRPENKHRFKDAFHRFIIEARFKPQ